MNEFMDKISNFFIRDNNVDMNGEPVAGEESARADSGHTTKQDKKVVKNSRPNIVAVPSKTKTGENMEIVLFKATCYEDMQAIARHIKDRKVAVVNFEGMDKMVAQRMVDFLSGATFALDGVPRKVSGGTFIFSSSQVDLSGKIMDRNSDFEAEDFTNDNRFSSNSWINS